LKGIFAGKSYDTIKQHKQKQKKERKRRRRRHKKKVKEGTARFRLTQTLRGTVQKSLSEKCDLRAAVRLPDGEIREEWIATNTMEIYNNVALVYETFVADKCTVDVCSEMRAGAEWVYMWSDSRKQKPVKMSAPEYIDKLLDWVGDQFADEAIFPADDCDPPTFGKRFEPTIRNILRKLVRIYSHIFCDHWERIKELKAETELLLCIKHFLFFVDEFGLVTDKELRPLASLIARIRNDEL
jgi:MOB kinase activator 1